MINTDVAVIPISKVFYYQNVTDRLLLQYIDTLIEHEIPGYQPFVSDVADVATLSPVIPFSSLRRPPPLTARHNSRSRI